ncbi:hypothetical protein [Lapidilactobacillus bayanensis]|uniref:hypothetical protein n=1 Tax=Lapidilactobacillus bayanensis TaxID=2485998 RepID=UPI000F7A9FA1|nr:hypothetical protein [Lapidilactobacillus bayanensis]
MDKQQLQTQLQQQLQDKRRFGRMLFIDDGGHAIAQIILGLGFIFLLFAALGWLALGANVLLTGSLAMKVMILKQALRVFWLLPLQPLLSLNSFVWTDWSSFLILAADIAFIYCLFWRLAQMIRRNRLYQKFNQQQLHLSLAAVYQLNGKYNLIYQNNATKGTLAQAIQALPEKQRVQWEKIIRRPSWLSNDQTAVDQEKIAQFMQTNFADTYQYLDVLLTAPASLPFYWSLTANQDVVATLSDNRQHHYYLLHYFDQHDQRVKVSWRQHCSNLIQLFLFH